MEADWSVDIGPELPRINGEWEGLIDLRDGRCAVDRVKEAAEHPAMQDALQALNGAHSLVFTTKCDIWRLEEREIDPYEFGASADTARAGFASYVDVLQLEFARFASFAFHEEWARGLASHLHSIDVPQGRVDVVLRIAVINKQVGYGLTLYSAGCGASDEDAYSSWQAVLTATVAATIAAVRASSSIG